MMKIILYILFFSFSFSQTKVGTSAVPFLGIGMGAKSIGMGGAYTTVVGSSESIYWNPANIARIENTVFQLQSANWLVDSKLSTFSIAMSLLKNASIGIYMNYLNYGEEIVTTVDDEFGNGDLWNASDFVLGGGLSWKITDRFSLGSVLKFINSKIYNESATTVAGDIGVLYESSNKNIRFGSSISNLGPNMIMDGKDLFKKIDLDPENSGHNETILAKLKTDEWPLPIIFRIGLSGNIKINSISDLLISTDAILPSDDAEHLNIGTQFTIYDKIFLRAGLRNIGLKYSEEKFTFGVGSHLTIFGNSIEFNYAYQHFGIFGFVPHYEFLIYR